MRVDPFADQRFADDDNHRADSYACWGEQVSKLDARSKECLVVHTAETETRESGGPASELCEHDRVCNEAEVQNAVNERNVKIPEDAYGFCHRHDERSRQVDP